MATAMKPIPEGYQSVVPNLTVKDGAKAIDFYKRAFGAEERFRMAAPDGSKIMHAELKIGDAIVMLADEFPEYGKRSPASLGGAGLSLFCYVPDADKAIERAVRAGATVTMPAADMFWGDRFGTVRDPFGHEWAFATHLRDVPMQEMEAGMRQMMAKQEA